MEVRSKIWLEIDGEPVFGSGRRALLDGIIRHGSINRAAKDINISYRKALSYIKTMEQRFGKMLVERRTGGTSGGGADLTAEAKELLQRYKMLEDGINGMLDKKFKKVFGPKKSYIKKLKLSGKIYDKNVIPANLPDGRQERESKKTGFRVKPGMT